MNELYHYGVKEKSGRYKWGSGDRPYQRLEVAGGIFAKKKSRSKTVSKRSSTPTLNPSFDTETNVRSALQKTGSKNYEHLGGYAKSIHTQDIAKNMQTMRNLDRQDVDSMLRCAESVNSSYKNLCDMVNAEQKKAFSNPEFRKELEKRLFDELGDGCDDKALYDMVILDAVSDLITKEKYMPGVQKALSTFNSDIDNYYNNSKNIADKMVKSIGDKTLVETKNYSIKYSDVINQKILNDTDNEWISYLARHGEEDAIWNSETSPIDIEQHGFSMEEYNQRHSQK